MKKLFTFRRKIFSFPFSTEASQPQFSSEYYVKNFSDASAAINIETLKINEHINLFSFPIYYNENFKALNEQIEKLAESPAENKRICLIQIDPTFHAYKKRIIFEKYRNDLVFKGVDTFDTLKNTNPLKLLSFIETRLETVIIPEYSPENLKKLKESENEDKELNQIFESLLESVFPNKNFKGYEFLINLLFLKSLNQEEVYLSQMPALYHRMLMGTSVSLSDLQEIFKLILSTCKEIQAMNKFLTISKAILSPITHFPNDVYLKVLLDEIKKNYPQREIDIFVQSPFYQPFQKYYEASKQNSFEWKDAFTLPSSPELESDEVMIEKHALLDLLNGTKIWDLAYISNPFPYLREDYEKLKEEDKKELKKIFYANYKKYENIMESFAGNQEKQK